jgi:transglutaminase-like putative cysteine protease
VKTQTPDYAYSKIGKTSGYYYLLVNQQNNTILSQSYNHFALKILNAEGLNTTSEISVEFDPSYQKLAFHSIQVVRGINIQNRLKKSSIQIIQRETQKERFVYDGRLTAIVNLEDIRVGDIIEYSYSLTGENPVYKNHYSRDFYLQYHIPIHHLFIRLITSIDRDIHLKYNHAASIPSISSTDVYNSYEWNEKDIPGLEVDTNTPVWYDSYPSVEISDFNSWKDVVNWGLPLYTMADGERTNLKSRIDELCNESSKESIISWAIRFVQDEIRYLGYVNGLNTFQPHPPTEVIAKRYGDCKDNSFLLSEILKLYDIEASPVLVNTQYGHDLKNALPSPDSFDHCIVRIKYEGNFIYVDPTISNQGGSLDHIFVPHYYTGLVIKNGQDGLTDIPVSDYSKINVKEVLEVDEIIGAGATLSVITTYSGGQADFMRNNFMSNDIYSIQKYCTDYYSRLFPSLVSNNLPRFSDHREKENMFITEESYRIDSLWSQSLSNPHLLEIEVYPLLLSAYVSVPPSPQRSMPYQLDYPVDIEYETIIKMPVEWTVETSEHAIKDQAFVFKCRTDYENKEIRINYKYKTFTDHIGADQASSFISKHNEILGRISFSVSYDKALAGSEFKFSWLAGFLSLIVLVIASITAVRLFENYDIAVANQPEKPRKLGGWLILVTIGISITPLLLIYDLISAPEYYNSYMWQGIFTLDGSSQNLMFGLLMGFEQIYNIVFLVFSVFVFMLLYNKRSTFPFFGVIFYVVSAIFIIIDSMLALNINPEVFTAADKLELYNEVTRSIIAAIIWVPYILRSKRVKQTFVCHTSTKNNEEPYESTDEIPSAWSSPVRIVFVSLNVLMIVGIGLMALPDYSPPNTEDMSDPVISSIDIPSRFSNPDLTPPSTVVNNSVSTGSYAILKCESRTKDIIQLSIITVADYEKAEEILISLNNGASFSKLVEQESIHPTKSNGGKLGTFQMSDFGANYREALVTIQPGQYTEIITISD